MSRPAAAVLAAACLLVPGYLAARERTHAAPHASVTTPAEAVTLKQWSLRVGKELDRHIIYPTLAGGQPFATGMVRVKFNCSESGRPDKVALLRSSGSRALDRAAVAAVGRIATLHPLPQGLGADQRYEAVVRFETDPDRLENRIRTIRAEALKTNAWFRDGTASASAREPGTILLAGL